MKTNSNDKKFLLVLVCLCIQALSIFAQEESDDFTPQKNVSFSANPSFVEAHCTTNINIIGIGSTSILDTYLSPEHYKGTELRFLNHTTWARGDKHWNSQMVHQAYISYSSPRSDDNNYMGAMYSFSFARMRNWSFLDGRLRVKAGIDGTGNLGILYNTGNGNNPAQARMSVTVGPNASACYDFRLFNRWLTARYEVSVPLLGVMFSPNFGQSYYEIFSRGDYDNNVKMVTPFNCPSMRHMFTVEFPIRKTTFSIGYLGDYQQSDVNLIKYHNYSHMLVLGLVRRFNIQNILP